MDKPTGDLAVVLKALEIRAVRQETEIRDLLASAEDALVEVNAIRDATEHFAGLIDGKSGTGVNLALGVRLGGPRSPVPEKLSPSLPPDESWGEVVTEAESILKEERIDPASVVVETPGALDLMDVVASLSFGALAAALPSIGGKGGYVQDAFFKIQQAAEQQKLPSLVQKLFGQKPAPFLDEGASGIYHRFVDGHDLLSAIPEGVRGLPP
jgi:hypothetical protein